MPRLGPAKTNSSRRKPPLRPDIACLGRVSVEHLKHPPRTVTPRATTRAIMLSSTEPVCQREPQRSDKEEAQQSELYHYQPTARSRQEAHQCESCARSSRWVCGVRGPTTCRAPVERRRICSCWCMTITTKAGRVCCHVICSIEAPRISTHFRGWQPRPATVPLPAR